MNTPPATFPRNRRNAIVAHLSPPRARPTSHISGHRLIRCMHPLGRAVCLPREELYAAESCNRHGLRTRAQHTHSHLRKLAGWFGSHNTSLSSHLSRSEFASRITVSNAQSHGRKVSRSPRSSHDLTAHLSQFWSHSHEPFVWYISLGCWIPGVWFPGCFLEFGGLEGYWKIPMGCSGIAWDMDEKHERHAWKALYTQGFCFLRHRYG